VRVDVAVKDDVEDDVDVTVECITTSVLASVEELVEDGDVVDGDAVPFGEWLDDSVLSEAPLVVVSVSCSRVVDDGVFEWPRNMALVDELLLSPSRLTS